MVRLTVTLDDATFRKGVRNLIEAGQNLRPMMEIAGGIFENSTRARFDSTRGPGGIPWPPSRRAQLTGGKTLQDKGNLRGSIRSNVGDRFVETGVDARSVSSKYAASHQFGVTIRPRKAKALAFTGADGHFYMVQSVTLPARPFLGIDDADLQDLREAFVGYLVGAANGD